MVLSFVCQSVTVLSSVLTFVYYPHKKEMLFSVCLSDRLSVSLYGTLFSHFVRVTPLTVFITHTNLHHLKGWRLECVIRWGVRFSIPLKFRPDRSLKTAQNHKLQFLARHNSKNFWTWTAIPILYKPCFRSLTRPTQFVRTSNVFVRNDF